MEEDKWNFSNPEPYPPIEICTRSPAYAKAMLANVGSCASEMTAVSLYLYNQTILAECEPEIAEIFHRISIVEMKHLSIFCRLSDLLGTDPRLWCYPGRNPVYWSPRCSRYTREIQELLKNALYGERQTVENYCRQCQWIEDEGIVKILKRIIMDEKCHIEIFQDLLCRY